LLCDVFPIVLKDRIQNPADILDHDRAGPYLIYHSDQRGKKIAFVQSAKLFPGHREWRAGQPCGNNVYTGKSSRVKGVQVVLDYIPFGTVLAQRRTRLLVNLNKADMVDARPL
jgi:hypothetical protein